MGERLFWVVLALSFAMALGCAGEPVPGKTSPGDGSTESLDPSEWNASLIPVAFEEWQQELASMEGQIVVVDFWATWCLPCVERFPHMVKLAHDYGDSGVTFISVCLDDRDDEDAVSLAQRFLTEQQATFPNFLMDEVVTQAFEKLDLLGIPAVFIYGPAGDLRYQLTGDDPNNQFTDADVVSAIEELLASG